MSEVHTGGCAVGAIRRESGDAAAFGAVDWLSLAAAPAFAIMAAECGAWWRSGGHSLLGGA